MILVEYVRDELPDEVFQILASGEFVGNPDNTPKSWTQSSVSRFPKWTEDAVTCVIAIVLGETPRGEWISLLVHPNKGAVNERKDLFEVEYPRSLQELGRQTVNRFAKIIGGYREPQVSKRTASFDYDLTVDRLKEYHRTNLGIETEVLPPKTFKGITNVFLTDRRIYVQELDEKSPFAIALRASSVSFPRIWK